MGNAGVHQLILADDPSAWVDAWFDRYPGPVNHVSPVASTIGQNSPKGASTRQ